MCDSKLNSQRVEFSIDVSSPGHPYRHISVSRKPTDIGSHGLGRESTFMNSNPKYLNTALCGLCEKIKKSDSGETDVQKTVDYLHELALGRALEPAAGNLSALHGKVKGFSHGARLWGYGDLSPF